ncbi:MAG: 5'-nucleotidase, lipoprotein e(P4) family [Ferruginibacter sp.]
MKQSNAFAIIAMLMLIIGCKSTSKIPQNKQPLLPQNITIGGKLFTTIYQQKSAEYRALCYQAYNIARLRIDNYKATDGRPLAIITDIDETIFDNSPYAAHRGLHGKDYESVSWYEWTDKSAADTMPGAGSFLKYAASKNIEIFYVTNREKRERMSTLKNLQRFALPNANEAHLLTRVTVSSKEERRMTVASSHNIILLMGDNLADFSVLFDKKPADERQRNTDASAAEFGKRFIIFPNPDYGDWEGALNKYNYALSVMQKDSIIKASLNSY